MNISDETAEKAARAAYVLYPATYYLDDTVVTWDQLSESGSGQRRKDKELGKARATLEAAAPYLMAQAWDVCAGAVEAATRLVAPDEITPMGARIINKAASNNPYRAAGSGD